MGADIYFSSGMIKGMGRVFFLRVPQEAPEGSASRRLLGSYVVEIDYGLFKLKEAPGLEHAWQPEYFFTKAAAVADLSGVELRQEASLAGFKQDYNIETKAGLNAKASFPGAPIGAGIELDYSKLKKASITLGPGSKKFYIPRDCIETAYKYFAAHSDQYNKVVFDPHRMLVDQIVIATNPQITVESHSSFGADFEAKATKINDLGGGVTFSRKSDRSYAIAVEDGKQYLFAIGAIQADRFAG